MKLPKCHITMEKKKEEYSFSGEVERSAVSACFAIKEITG